MHWRIQQGRRNNDKDSFATWLLKLLKLHWKIPHITKLCMYKITNQLVDITAEDQLKQNTRTGRGHKQQKYTKICYNIRRYGDTFFPATTPYWNRLPEATVDAAIIPSFSQESKVGFVYRWSTDKPIQIQAYAQLFLDIWPTMGRIESLWLSSSKTSHIFSL